VRRKYDIYAELHNFGRRIDLHIAKAYEADATVIQVATPLVFVPVDRDVLNTGEQPAMSLALDDAQSLMDSLWRCGMRPSEGSGSAGALAATERHLADMQKISFDFLRLIKE
jgi:hypothetical protein